MNKLMIVVGMLSSVSLPKPNEIKRDGTILHSNSQIEWSIENVQHLKSWILEDLNNEIIDSTTAKLYWSTLDETEDFLIDYYVRNKK